MKTRNYIGLVALTFAVLTPVPGLLAQDVQPEMRVLEWPDGTRFEGGILNGMKEGPGIISWPDGTRFEGTFSNDMREGEGTMTFPDGTVVTGTFSEDRLVVTEQGIESGTETGAEIAAENEPESERVPEPAVSPVPAQIAVEPPVTEPSPAEQEVPTQEPAAELSEVVQESAEPPIAEAAAPPASQAAATRAVVETRTPRPESPIFTYQLEDEIVAVIDAWARAWSAQNPELYLSFYSESFEVPDGLSKQAWENQRISRIRSPGFIQVDIGYGQFELVDDDVIEVSIRQGYSSDTYSDFTNKMMRLQKEDNLWKIVQEQPL